MATKPKSGNGPAKRGRAPTKPATIDLEAKDVSKASTTDKTVKTEADKSKPSSQNFGRAASNKTANTTQTSAKPESKPSEKSNTPKEPNNQPNSEKSRSNLTSGLIGAAAAVFGLGFLGQFNFAPHIPLLGSIYSDGSQASDTTDQLQILNARIDELAAEQNSATATDNVEVTELNQKIANLEIALAGINTNDSTERLAAIEEELAKVAALATTPITTEGENTDSSTLLNSKIAELNAKISNLSPLNIEPIENDLNALKAEIAALEEEVSKNSNGINSINELAGKLDEQVDKIAVGNKVAQNVAVNAIGSALQNDEALSDPISSLEALGSRTDETLRLAELSREGIPSLKALNQELDTIINSVQNPSAGDETGSLTDKLWANARSLVTVRSSGPREGDSASAVLSRVKANLNDRDLDAVKVEWKKLPPKLSVQHNDWIIKLEKRAEALALYQTISDKFSNPAG